MKIYHYTNAIEKIVNFFNLKRFPLYLQSEKKDCAPAYLMMIAKYYGIGIDINQLRTICETTRIGTSIKGILEGLNYLGFNVRAIRISASQLNTNEILPAICYWDSSHYVVLYRVTKEYFYIADPSSGRYRKKIKDFEKSFNRLDDSRGTIVLLDDENLVNKNFSNQTKSFSSFSLFKNALLPNKKFVFALVLLISIVTILSLLLPLILEHIVDTAIEINALKNIPFIAVSVYLIAIILRKLLEFITDLISIKLSLRVNVMMVTTYIEKLLAMPISYFDSKISSDLIQKVEDHEEFEEFLSESFSQALVGILTIIGFSVLLLTYNTYACLIFILATVIQLLWVFLFLEKRKVLDYEGFSLRTQESDFVIDLVEGAEELKFNKFESFKTDNWGKIRTKVYNHQRKKLIVQKLQIQGSFFLGELRNLSIILLSIYLVSQELISFGILLSITFMLGILELPIEELIRFINNFQDNKLALRRIAEIHSFKNEQTSSVSIETINNLYTKSKGIDIINLSFRYPGTIKNVLNNVNLLIPKGKVTAIVGSSGEGKSTLIKLILKYYTPQSGHIKLVNNIQNFSEKEWHSLFGVVLQVGYIFSISVKNNIIMGNVFNEKKFHKIVSSTQVTEFMNDLPNKENTLIGKDGINLSVGQKQRILLARALYKDPAILILDEATSSLDAINEKKILLNLKTFYREKTVLVIAHRLSTIKEADQIVVFHKGEIVEIGEHQKLLSNGKTYSKLVKDQLYN